MFKFFINCFNQRNFSVLFCPFFTNWDESCCKNIENLVNKLFYAIIMALNPFDVKIVSASRSSNPLKNTVGYSVDPTTPR